MTKSKKQENRGFALMVAIITILAVCIVIGIGLSSLIYNNILATNSKIKSAQSYYTAEAGIEDTLLRLKNGLQTFSPNSIVVGGTLATLTIVDDVDGSKIIESEGNNDNRKRKVSVTYAVTTDEVNFFYGVQAGDGGILMGNNSTIIGNVFSNGSILPLGGGMANATGTVVVANIGNKIDSLNVGEDAYAHSCKDSDIVGDLHYVAGGSSVNCTAGGSVNVEPAAVAPQDLPISDAQIDEWRNTAALGGTIAGDYTIAGGVTETLGPVKITGNLLVDISATLNISGTIYVTGNITIENNAIVQLDPGYGPMSGVILCDGKLQVNNNAILNGSGEDGSYLMLLSDDNSVDPANPAINVVNNALGAVFYASKGAVKLNNNINIREATGYKLILENNAVVRYESGLANTLFSGGPGGGWQVTNWQEIE